ncbi:MAG: hypothetical protein AAGB51_06205 [Planctomycetota bacterium]
MPTTPTLFPHGDHAVHYASFLRTRQRAHLETAIERVGLHIARITQFMQPDTTNRDSGVSYGNLTTMLTIAEQALAKYEERLESIGSGARARFRHS